MTMTTSIRMMSMDRWSPGSVKYSIAAIQVSFTTSICLGFVRPCGTSHDNIHLYWNILLGSVVQFIMIIFMRIEIYSVCMSCWTFGRFTWPWRKHSNLVTQKLLLSTKPPWNSMARDSKYMEYMMTKTIINVNMRGKKVKVFFLWMVSQTTNVMLKLTIKN